MTHRFLALAAALTIGFLSPTTAEAAKKNKGKRGERNAAAMLGRFDRDSSGALEGKESERVRKLYSALKELDTDKNGELTDSEITATKIQKPKRKAGKRKAGKSAAA